MATSDGSLQLWVGTKKGAFLFRSRDRQRWDVEGPFLAGQEVNHVAQDPHDPQRLYAAGGTSWFGPHLYASTDGGCTWNLSENGLAVKDLPGASLKRIWHIAPSSDEPGTVYVGADPGVLFRSRDYGVNWEMVDGLSRHASRDQWHEGGGGMMVHSIQCLGKGRIVVGMSVAGAFRSTDDGETWQPFNGGVLADYQPARYPEVGQCVHKLLAHPAQPEALYQQNHCGVYRARFDGAEWTDISDGLPTRFGFALAVPAAEPETLFTVPITSPEFRFVPDGKLRVGRSRDGGRTWELLTEGLPQDHAYVLVLREAMTSDNRDPAGVYFGTASGAVFATCDGGDSWRALAQHLPPVYSVSMAKSN